MPARSQHGAAVSRKRCRCHSALLNPSSFGDLLAALVHEAEVDVAFRRREDESTFRHLGMPAKDVRDLLRERHGALLPVLRQERVLRFRAHVHAAVRQIQIRPVQRLQFATSQAGGEREGEDGALPVRALLKELLEVRVGRRD